MKHLIALANILAASALASACSATHHAADVRAANDVDRITVGTVQKEIRIGMSATDVAAALGSPNIVSSDGDRQQSWIYDKISTDVVESKSSGTVVGLIFGSSGGGAGTGTMSGGARSTSQRTLTVIVKFDAEQRVRDFSYHSSRF
ncbi:MAG: hypothetical protein OEW68_15545 [Gammaproteobacteria bacterium]|nr:hypothetical protein [Gammaproteobacteria bacterium]MDH4316241.1 hypothetical protein [Gammaproteobacteria bacterium]MDH5214107.1 hypothetical protein [Gammaproteobacteria bacterium]